MAITNEVNITGKAAKPKAARKPRENNNFMFTFSLPTEQKRYLDGEARRNRTDIATYIRLLIAADMAKNHGNGRIGNNSKVVCADG